MRTRINELWQGEIPLPNMFFGYWLGLSTFLYTSAGSIFSLGMVLLKINFNGWLIYKSIFISASTITICAIILNIFMMLCIMKNVDKYQGRELWKIATYFFIICMSVSYFFMIKSILSDWRNLISWASFWMGWANGIIR